MWKPISGYEGLYEVSDAGEVRSLDRTVPRSDGKPCFRKGKVLKTPVGTTGYKYVNLAGKGHRVHILVAAAFLGPRPEGLQVSHDNGDRLLNTPWNMSYVTNAENQSMRARQGTRKLTPSQVRAVRFVSRIKPKPGFWRKLAKIWGVSPSTLSAILHRGDYRNVK